MPPQVLLSFLSCCSLAWEWVRFAGCSALTWDGLLRPGVLLNARRGHLQLLSDVNHSVRFVSGGHTTARRRDS